jgi:hypothetical protein
MTTAYSDKQLDAMEALFEKQLPRLPNEKDLQRLPMVDAVAAAGSPFGMWVRLHLEAGQFVLLFLNPMVMFYLFSGINECAMAGGWWSSQVKFTGSDMPAPTAENTQNAVEVISLTTASAGDLVVLHLVRRGGENQFIGLRKQTAIDLFLTIKTAAEQFRLWDEDFNFLPGANSQRITDEEIVRAANQLIRQHQDTAQSEATSRSRAAYSVGDMFNFDMWERVAKAVTQFAQAKPGDSVN